MPQIFVEDELDGGGRGWVPVPVPSERLDMSEVDGLQPAWPERAATLLRTSSIGPSWVLVAAPQVRVNGMALPGGVRVLRHGDELGTVGGGRAYFSTESLARIELFPATQAKTFCARCKSEIEPGSPAVRCPACAAWHHQSDTYPCWTYAPKCTLCDQTTDLDAGFRWTPEGL